MSVCQKCHKEFKYNYLLKRHMNKKIDCSNIQNNNIFEDNNEIIDIKLKIKQNQEEINKIDECIKNSINKPNNINKCNFCNKLMNITQYTAEKQRYNCIKCKILHDFDNYDIDEYVIYKFMDLLNCDN